MTMWKQYATMWKQSWSYSTENYHQTLLLKFEIRAYPAYCKHNMAFTRAKFNTQHLNIQKSKCVRKHSMAATRLHLSCNLSEVWRGLGQERFHFAQSFKQTITWQLRIFKQIHRIQNWFLRVLLIRRSQPRAMSAGFPSTSAGDFTSTFFPSAWNGLNSQLLACRFETDLSISFLQCPDLNY